MLELGDTLQTLLELFMLQSVRLKLSPGTFMEGQVLEGTLQTLLELFISQSVRPKLKLSPGTFMAVMAFIAWSLCRHCWICSCCCSWSLWRICRSWKISCQLCWSCSVAKGEAEPGYLYGGYGYGLGYGGLGYGGLGYAGY